MADRRAHLDEVIRRYERNLQRLELQIADAGGPDRVGIDVVNAMENTQALLAGLYAERDGAYSATTLKEIGSEGQAHVILTKLMAQDRHFEEFRAWRQRRDRLLFAFIVLLALAEMARIVLGF